MANNCEEDCVNGLVLWYQSIVHSIKQKFLKRTTHFFALHTSEESSARTSRYFENILLIQLQLIAWTRSVYDFVFFSAPQPLQAKDRMTQHFSFLLKLFHAIIVNVGAKWCKWARVCIVFVNRYRSSFFLALLRSWLNS